MQRYPLHLIWLPKKSFKVSVKASDGVLSVLKTVKAGLQIMLKVMPYVTYEQNLEITFWGFKY